MDRSLAFYRDLLGFEVVSDETESGTAVNAGVGLEKVKLRCCLLKVGEGETMIELLHYLYPPGKSLAPDAKSNDIGIGHIAFAVSNVHKLYEELSRKGVKFKSPPQFSGITTFVYFYDPDGGIREFEEQVKE